MGPRPGRAGGGLQEPHPTPSEDLLAFAEEAGVTLDVPAWRANTRLALLGTPYATAHGRAEAYVDAAFRAYWERHDDLRDDAVLARIAREAGLDPDAFLGAVRGGAWEAYLAGVDALGEKLEVETTVTYVLPDEATFVGLGTYAELKAALAPAAPAKRVGEEKAKPRRG